jgi:hypothetical protein
MLRHFPPLHKRCWISLAVLQPLAAMASWYGDGGVRVSPHRQRHRCPAGGQRRKGPHAFAQVGHHRCMRNRRARAAIRVRLRLGQRGRSLPWPLGRATQPAKPAPIVRALPWYPMLTTGCNTSKRKRSTNCWPRGLAAHNIEHIGNFTGVGLAASGTRA